MLTGYMLTAFDGGTRQDEARHLHCKKISVYPRIFCGEFRVLASLFHLFMDTNVYGTGSI